MQEAVAWQSLMLRCANLSFECGRKSAGELADAAVFPIFGIQWRHPEDVKASYPKASILKGSRVIDAETV
jgi:hypothetical protein